MFVVIGGGVLHLVGLLALANELRKTLRDKHQAETAR
jgi:hypothetical protein